VQQREVGVDVPSVLAGIEAAMMQDADVLLVTEVKTLEDLQACITAAETGHLVIIVLHPAATPAEAIRRIMDIFPEDIADAARRAFANVLRGVSTQLLLPKIGGGRVPAYGVIIPDDEMRSAIIEGRDILHRESPLPDGCTDLATEIERLRNEGRVTDDSARRTLARI
jgi:twitching motility protein PilT